MAVPSNQREETAMNDRDPLIVEWHRNLPVSVPGVGALVATWDEIADLVEQARAAALNAATEAVAANRLTGPGSEGWEHTINETIDDALAAIDALRGESNG